MIRAALVALLIAGCGSVVELRATEAGAEASPVDAADASTVVDSGPALDAPASGDTPAENPPDAGTVEVGREVAIAPACGGPGIEVVERCLPNCWACRWRDWSTPSPDGCSAPTGELCRPGCELCR